MTTNDTGNTPSNGVMKTTKFNKIEEIIPEEEVEKMASVVVPPDGGWAWVVMVASFICNVVTDGIVLTSSVLNESLKKEYQISDGYVALVNSLLCGFYLMSGPFVSALANRYGFRPVTMFGAVFGAGALVLSSYATSFEFLLISYGVLGGIGLSLVYIPSVITIGYYFEKWRALATGIAMCGSGVGTFLFAPLLTWLIKKYDWRTALLVQAAVVLSCVVYAVAYRPIKPIELAIVDKEDGEEEEEAVAEPKQTFVTPQKKPLPEGRFAYSVPNSAHNTYMGSTHHHYPTAAEVFRGVNIERKLSGISGKGTEMKNLRKSQPPTPNGEIQNAFNLHKELTTVGENEEEENQNLITENNGQKPMIKQARRHTVSGRRPIDENFLKNRNKLSRTPLSGSRPMYRDDIFFAGSLARIPQYTSQTSLAYHMSVTRIATKQDLMEEEERSCKLCPEAVRRTLATMLDTSLLKSPSFMLLSISGFLTMMGFFVPFTYVISRAKDAQMDETAATFILQVIGISNTVARIACGILSSFESISALHLNNVAITVGGLATIFSGVLITTATQYTFAALFGICIACFSALRSIIAVELMGIEKLTNAYGFLMLFQGIASAMGSPIAGVLLTITGSYNGSFYFAGALITLSAICCYPLTYVSKWETRREERRQKESEVSP